MAIHLHPSLTSVDTNMARIAREALRMLLSRSEDLTRDVATELIKGNLHVRESTSLWGSH